MRDTELIALIRDASGPFPRDVADEEIQGVDLVLLDDVIFGAASHYERNARPLSDEHRTWLTEAVRDLDDVWSSLPSDDAREYFARSRGIALYLLERR